MESKKCFSFTWIQENFAYGIFEKAEAFESPTFIVDTIEKTKWRMMICPMEKTKWRLRLQPRETNSLLDRSFIDGNSISIYLIRDLTSKGPDSVEIDYELAFLSADGSILKSPLYQNQAFQRNDGYALPSFEIRQNVFDRKGSTLLAGDTLTVRCRMWKSVGEVKTDGQCIARTRFEVERRCFLWKTEKFSSLQIKKESLRIRSASNDKPVLSLNLLVSQNLNMKLDRIEISFSSPTGMPAFFTFKTSVIDAKGIPVDCGQYDVWLNTFGLRDVITLPLTKDSLLHNSKMYLPNDTLTLLCDCTFSTGVFWGMVESIFYGIKNECSNPVSPSGAFVQNKELLDVKKNRDPLMYQAEVQIRELKADIASMLKENIQCDVQLLVGNETFPAHWFILSARSPVFRAMCKSDMKEKAKDRIDIEDLKPDTVRRMLLYMYTDSLEELQWEIASALYSASDKYEILGLKDKCSTFLKTNLSLTNACEVLILADLHQDKDLKSPVQDFILKHDVDIINSDSWRVLMETNAHLAAETMFLKFKK